MKREDITPGGSTERRRLRSQTPGEDGTRVGAGGWGRGDMQSGLTWDRVSAL